MKTALETSLELLATFCDTMEVLAGEKRFKHCDDEEWRLYVTSAKFLKEQGKRNYDLEAVENYLNPEDDDDHCPSDWYAGGFAKNH